MRACGKSQARVCADCIKLFSLKRSEIASHQGKVSMATQPGLWAADTSGSGGSGAALAPPAAGHAAQAKPQARRDLQHLRVLIPQGFLAVTTPRPRGTPCSPLTPTGPNLGK